MSWGWWGGFCGAPCLRRLHDGTTVVSHTPKKRRRKKASHRTRKSREKSKKLYNGGRSGVGLYCENMDSGGKRQQHPATVKGTSRISTGDIHRKSGQQEKKRQGP